MILEGSSAIVRVSVLNACARAAPPPIKLIAAVSTTNAAAGHRVFVIPAPVADRLGFVDKIPRDPEHNDSQKTPSATAI